MLTKVGHYNLFIIKEIFYLINKHDFSQNNSKKSIPYRWRCIKKIFIKVGRGRRRISE